MLSDLVKHNSQFIGYAMNLCKNKALAEDLVQDMYLKVGQYNKEQIKPFYAIQTIKHLYYNKYNKNKTKEGKRKVRCFDWNLLMSFDNDKANNEFTISENYGFNINYLIVDDKESDLSDEDLKTLKRFEKLDEETKSFIIKNEHISLREISETIDKSYFYVFDKIRKGKQKVLRNG